MVPWHLLQRTVAPLKYLCAKPKIKCMYNQNFSPLFVEWLGQIVLIILKFRKFLLVQVAFLIRAVMTKHVVHHSWILRVCSEIFLCRLEQLPIMENSHVFTAHVLQALHLVHLQSETLLNQGGIWAEGAVDFIWMYLNWMNNRCHLKLFDLKEPQISCDLFLAAVFDVSSETCVIWNSIKNGEQLSA